MDDSFMEETHVPNFEFLRKFRDDFDVNMNSFSLCLKPSELEKKMIDEARKVQEIAPFVS